MKNRLSSLPVFALLTASIFAGCSSNSSDATLTVHNEETVAITDLYVNSVGNENFSDNLLGSVPLQPGDSIQIDVVCDNYDVELLDAAGGDCKILNTSLCFSDSDWLITDTFCSFSARKDDGTKLPMLQVPRTMNASQRTTK
jgi:hypothetical protein